MLKPFALILSALLLAMTSYVQASTTEAAEAAALAWLEAIDQGEYEQAWEKSSPLLKTPLSPTMLQRGVTLARNDLGSVESRRRIRMSQYTSMPGAPRNDYKEFAFKTQFTNNQRVVEVVKEVMQHRVLFATSFSLVQAATCKHPAKHTIACMHVP